MKYEVRTKKRKLNRRKIFLVFLTFIALIIFIVMMIKKQDKMSENLAITNDMAQENAIIVDQSGQEGQEGQEEQNEIIEQKSEENKVNSYDFSGLNTEELERFDKIYSRSDPKRVFLTFDDGPTSQVTPYILDLLRDEGIKATFFVLGSRVDANPDLVKREYEEGHFIANHGYSHSYSKIYQSSDAVLNEYNTTVNSIRNAIGNPNYNSLVFRFPGGSVGGPYDSMKKATKQVLREQGIASVDWNALSGDAEGIKTKEGLYNRFLQTASSYSSVVLLMHDAADKILTYEVLPQIISYCRNNGYEFKTMYDLILREN